MSVIPNQNNRHKLIWSSIRSQLNISLHEKNIVNLIKVPEAQDRLVKFLSFYTDGNKNENLPNNLKFLNRYDIDAYMRDFIINIAECLNMTKINCFELLNNYFFVHEEEFEKLSKLLKLFMSYNDKNSIRYQNIITDLEDKKVKIIEFYFKERKNLILFYLDIFLKIFLEIENTPMSLMQLMDNMIKSKKLLEVFYKQLVIFDNDGADTIEKVFDKSKLNNHFVKEIIYKVPVYICEEQKMILELIMILLNEGKYNDPLVFEGLFNYFLKTQFYCFSQNLNADNIRLKDEIMIKSILITLNIFQAETINKVMEGETNLINNITILHNNFNFNSIFKVYEQPINNRILFPIKLTIKSIIEFIIKYRNNINGSNNIINTFNNIPNRDISERESFTFLNVIDEKIQILEGENSNEKGLTIYDIYYNILYDWLNMIMGLYYEENIDRYDIYLYSLLFRVLSHFLPQRKFYSSLFNHKPNNISNLFNVLKQDEDKKGTFLNLCFSLSKSIEPGEGSDNNEYLLNILSIEPIDKLKNKFEECQDDIKRLKILDDCEKDIFFSDIFEQWNSLIQELYEYSQQFQNQVQLQESLPDELSSQINYIRLFIRSVLPRDSFSNFIFNYTCYYNLKEQFTQNKNNIDEDDKLNLGIQTYNPEIFKKLIFNSVTVLSLITELQIQNRRLLFGEFITELLKLFTLFTKDSHFTECLKKMNYFFEKFGGKNIIYNIIVNDNNTQDFNNTLYVIKFIKEMFKPDIFLVVARSEDFNAQNKYGENFYFQIFYFIKKTLNYFTQVNDYLIPLNALLISELGNVMVQIMEYLEFKNNNYKIDIIEAQNNYNENNLVNLVIRLLMQDNKDYEFEEGNNQNNSDNLLLIDFIFKYIGIKIDDNGVLNLNINEIRKNIFYNNTYIQLYINTNKINKENNNVNNGYNISCYKKMILSVLNCLNKILSLIIMINEKDNKVDNKTDNKNMIQKYNSINFINKLNVAFVEAKEIPHYIYESIDDKRKFNLNLILLLFFYSLYEIEKNEQLNVQRKHIINLDEDNPSDLHFFMANLNNDSNISTLALNTLCKIIYLIKDTGININNYFTLEKITSTELNTNINLFKFIRNKLLSILKSQNTDVDLLKIEILKFLIISTKYQHTFIRDFIQGDDDIRHNDILFINLNESLKVNRNYRDNDIHNNENDYDIKIESKSLKAELFTYIIMFVSELLNETQDIKIIENLLLKDNGIILMNNIIHYGLQSCNISKNYDEFYKIFTTNLSNFKNNISDILFMSNSFKIVIDVLSLKLNIIKSLSMIFKRILLFCKQTKNISIKFKYSKEIKYFIQTHLSNLVEFYSKGNDYDYFKVIQNAKKDLLLSGIQLKPKYLSDNDNMNNSNLEMLIENYLYRYDYNYSFDIKELIIKGFYDNLFKEKYLKSIVINNCFISYHCLLVQSLAQSAHLYGLIFSIGEYNYLLTNKLFTDVEVYKIFNESVNNNQLINTYSEEINSILNYDNCYNYKLTFNPLKDLGEDNENDIIRFIKQNIIDKCINAQSVPNLTLNEHRLYYQILNCSFDYIIYLYNKSACSQNKIKIKMDLFNLLKKINIIINDGVSNNNISDNNLLSVFNLIYHILYYLILTEKTFDSSDAYKDDKNLGSINFNIINNEIEIDDNEKIQVIIELMNVLIMIFKKIKECRSIILYIFSCIVMINNDLLKNQIMELFDIIIKLYTKENDSFEFHSFLLLLNRLKINYPNILMEILKDAQIFNFITFKCGYNSDINLYENQNHTLGHLIYCYTLKTFSNILNTYLTKINTELKPNYNTVISNTMKFIELIQQRLKTLFNICINNNNFLSGLNQNNYITLAYLDELKSSIEFITSFISIECENACPYTKDKSFLEFLFDSVDLISNTCLFLYKNGYQNIINLCKPNSKLENLMLNTKITKEDINENNNNSNNYLNLGSQFSFENENNIYKELFSNNNNNNNNNDGRNRSSRSSISEDKTANVFHYKIKSDLIMILFHISSSMAQLLNRQNFNIKQYFFNKYQLKDNENQLNNWPMLYLNSIKYSIDFLKDISLNIKKYKLLYNKTTIILSSCNVSLGNCFMNELDPVYPLNELIDLILFILNDFCTLTPHYNEFIELLIKNHPYINNSRAILGDVYQLTKGINNELIKYARELNEEDNFLDDFEDLKNNIGNAFKSFQYKIKN